MSGFTNGGEFEEWQFGARYTASPYRRTAPNGPPTQVFPHVAERPNPVRHDAFQFLHPQSYNHPKLPLNNQRQFEPLTGYLKVPGAVPLDGNKAISGSYTVAGGPHVQSTHGVDIAPPATSCYYNQNLTFLKASSGLRHVNNAPPNTSNFHFSPLNQNMENAYILDEGYIEDVKAQSPGENWFPYVNTDASGQRKIFYRQRPPPGNLYQYLCSSMLRTRPHCIPQTEPLRHNLGLPSLQNQSIRGNQFPCESTAFHQSNLINEHIENEYEEIRDVAQYLTYPVPPKPSDTNDELEKVKMNSPSSALSSHSSVAEAASVSEPKGKSNPLQEHSDTSFSSGPKHFKSFSSSDDIIAEVMQVQQGHHRVLDQLNLEVENLLIGSSTKEIDSMELEAKKVCVELLEEKSSENKENTTVAHFSPALPSYPSIDTDDKLMKKYIAENFTFTRKQKPFRHNAHSLESIKENLRQNSISTLPKPQRGFPSPQDSQEHLEMFSKKRKSRASLAPMIPKWKIREHIKRLPFLRRNSDKEKTQEREESSFLSKAEALPCRSGIEIVESVRKVSSHGSSSSGPSSGVLRKVQAEVTTQCRRGSMSASVEQLPVAGEDHWYSADSDTESESLNNLHGAGRRSSQPNGGERCHVNGGIKEEELREREEGRRHSATLNLPTGITAPFGQKINNYASRMDLSETNHPDFPKAPKFRRGTGVKTKSKDLTFKWKSNFKNLDEDNRLLRWFSLRKSQIGSEFTNGKGGSGEQASGSLAQLKEDDGKKTNFAEEEGYWPRRTVQPPSLGPPPSNLTSEQQTRRHILAAIIHSENSYVASLQRLVNEYKKPLECSNPSILSQSKISTIFHRVPEILQCHSLFRIALAECVRRWDSDEKLGDVFVASFSKSLVLDVYSEFINNFGFAMETAKNEARRKSSFADFLKVKQITAHDRLSLFGLMVRPVQRFPQFILLLQDLLKHTPNDHHDRMSLQLALTQLESLAAMLNERKRECEQNQAFRETIKSIGGKFVLFRNLTDDPNRYLIRQDVVNQLEFDTNDGSISKCKKRKLLLLNDMLVCCSLAKSDEDEGAYSSTPLDPSSSSSNSNKKTLGVNFSSNKTSRKSAKSVYKWSCSVRDIEVDDVSISPTISHFISSSSSTLSLKFKSSSSTDSQPGNEKSNSDDGTSTANSLLEEMQALMHDYEVLSRISRLVSTLKSSYEGLCESSIKNMMVDIQNKIKCHDEQISLFDSSCLTITTGSGNHKETYVFQMESPKVRDEWIQELRLAQLALDPNNSPAWDIPQDTPYPIVRLPLFVQNLPVYNYPIPSLVKAGCFFKQLTTTGIGRTKVQELLWVSATDGSSSHISCIKCQDTRMKELYSFDIPNHSVNDMVFVNDFIWIATNDKKISTYDPSDADKGPVKKMNLSDSILKMIEYRNFVYAGLADGSLEIFDQNAILSTGKLSSKLKLKLGSHPILSIFACRGHVYAACGNALVIIDTKTHIIERSVILSHHSGFITHMTCSGVGLWITTQKNGTVSLYHLESLQHLQDINIAPSVFRLIRDSFRRQKGVQVSTLLAHKGWLWIGTNLGVVLTIPLPRLEGVPIISTGKANVSYHGFNGPITFLFPLTHEPPISPSSSNGKDAQNSKGNGKPKLERSRNVDSTKFDKFDTFSVNERDLTVSYAEKGSSMASIENSSTDLSRQAEDGDGSPTPSEGGKSEKGTIGSTRGPVVYRKKCSKENLVGGLRHSRTLPRANSHLPLNVRFSIDSDVYGLYGNLINIDGLEEEGHFVDPLYDALRRSDPELNVLDAKISTMDRQMKMRLTRPRSLDLSNWSMDSKISASSDDSGGIESRNDSDNPSLKGSLEKKEKGQSVDSKASVPHIPEPSTTIARGKTCKKSSNAAPPEQTTVVLVGGSGYVNMNEAGTDQFYLGGGSEDKVSLSLTVWQMKT